MSQVISENETPDPEQNAKEKASAHGMSMGRLYTRRFLRNKPAVAGLIIFVFLLFIAFFGSRLTAYSFGDQDFTVTLNEELRRPSFMIDHSKIDDTIMQSVEASPVHQGSHLLGTDSAGHDLFARTVQGLQRSILISVIAAVATTIISALVGTAAAYLGGRWERLILGLIHFLLVVPSFLLIALFVADSGGDWKVLTFVLIAFGWMYQARVIWSMAMSVREREYIMAARYMGVRGFTTIIRHMIPNIGSLLIIYLMFGIVSTIMSETGLSFLGLGVKMPDVSLGTLLQQGAGSVQSLPWVFWVPAITVTLLTVSMALIADGMRDALDPNSSAGGTA